MKPYYSFRFRIVVAETHIIRDDSAHARLVDQVVKGAPADSSTTAKNYDREEQEGPDDSYKYGRYRAKYIAVFNHAFVGGNGSSP